MKETTDLYVPRGNAAKLVFESRDPEVLISGPAGTGKSRAALQKIHYLCLLNANLRALIVRKTMTSLTSSALVTWRTYVAANALRVSDVWYYGGSRQEAPQYRYHNGSSVTIGGLDKPSKLMSTEYDVIFVQEATELTEDDWETLTTRLRNNKISYQQIIGDANPNVPTHWIKKRCDRGQTRMLGTRHEDNPLLFDEDGKITELGVDYISKLDALTGVRKARLRHGKWVAAEGIVYEDFDPDVHILDYHPPLFTEWDRYWSIDFGFTNPFVLQCWAVDGDGRAYLYRELYRTKRLVEDHARDILEIVAPEGQWREPKPVAIICDHDAEGRATLERHLGFTTVKADKRVIAGVQAMQARFVKADDLKPRIYLMRNALVSRDPVLIDAKLPTSTLEELPGYCWPQGVATTQAARDRQEVPIKENDHGMDAARYLVAQLDLVGRPRLRWM